MFHFRPLKNVMLRRLFDRKMLSGFLLNQKHADTKMVTQAAPIGAILVNLFEIIKYKQISLFLCIGVSVAGFLCRDRSNANIRLAVRTTYIVNSPWTALLTLQSIPKIG